MNGPWNYDGRVLRWSGVQNNIKMRTVTTGRCPPTFE